MRLWRIAADTAAFQADDRSGEGARLFGGRWNSEGHPMLYCAESRALAALETLVHINTRGLPMNRYLVAIDVPDAIWSERQRVDPAMAVGWDAEPPGQASVDVGDAWLLSHSSLVLEAPSVVVPEESSLLLNPQHRDMAHITIAKVRRWLYDPRLIGVRAATQ